LNCASVVTKIGVAVPPPVVDEPWLAQPIGFASLAM